MKILSIFPLIAVISAVSYEELYRGEFETFKMEFNKSYTSDTEEKSRFKIYLENKQRIERHNAEYDRGETSYTMAINQFADMLPDEVKETMTGVRKPKQSLFSGKIETFVAKQEQLENSVDWREKGAVTPVKNQGLCGSCWAFSAIGSLEGQNFLKTGQLVSLSEQNLVDCSFDYGNQGCNGGFPSAAFEYIRDNGGIDTENEYPYEAADERCSYHRSTDGIKIEGYKTVSQGDEDALKEAVAKRGPISVCICVNDNFVNYQQGVFYDDNCRQVDHSVVVVGYGTTEKGEDYWLVKNSWDESWGDNGYIKMARNRNNNCEIASYATFPIVA